MGMRKRIEARVQQELRHGHLTLSKADAVLDEVLEMLEKGVKLSLNIWGKDIPVVLKIEPDDDEAEA